MLLLTPANLSLPLQAHPVGGRAPVQNVVARLLSLNDPGKWRMKIEIGLEKTSSND